MQANWSLILNVLLLIGVIVAIGSLMKARRKSFTPDRVQPSPGQKQNSPYDDQPFKDDIIAVRKVNKDVTLQLDEQEAVQKIADTQSKPRLSTIANESPGGSHQQITSNQHPLIRPAGTFSPCLGRREKEGGYLEEEERREPKKEERLNAPSMVMMFLLAKDNRQFAGYELLQTLLAAGLRFGEGQLFHRHQFVNGQGPVLCSLAAATASGVFDLHNIGAFTVRGLCLYMHASSNPNIDAERFSIMLETAKQLSEGLDAHLLDDQRKQLTEVGVERYKRMLQIGNLVHEGVET